MTITFINKGIALLTQFKLKGLNNYSVEIPHEHFELIKLANKNLFQALFIEDKLNLVLENYAELE